MTRVPELDVQSRVDRDLWRCRLFVKQHASGRPLDRIREVKRAIRLVRATPELNPVRRTEPVSGLQMRRHNVDQFVIIYVYFRPCESMPNGMVSIRAIRHAREEDVFWGVHDSAAAEDASWFERAHLTLRDEG